MTKGRSDSFFYDLFAPLYDLFIWAAALPFGGEDRWRTRVADAAACRSGSKVLEVYAGTAAVAALCAGRGARAAALDLSGGMLRAARARGGQAVGLVMGDAAELPFADGAFDSVVACLGLHEVDKKTVLGTFGEAARVLRKGGRFVIFDFYMAEGAAGFFQKLFFTFFEGETAHAWVGMDLQDMLGRAGFRNFKREFFFKRSLQLLTVEKA